MTLMEDIVDENEVVTGKKEIELTMADDYVIYTNITVVK